MPKQAWVIAAVLTGLLAVGVLGYSSWKLNEELQRSRSELAQARETARTNLTELADAHLALDESRSRIEELKQRTDEVVRQRSQLEEKMLESLQSKDVTISELQGKLTVNILNRVLFDSGRVELKPSGREVLLKVATLLQEHPNQQVHVIGHTDNVPIRSQPWSKYPSNWELSTARATAAVRFLSEEAEIDPRRLGAVGYGEFRPIADNSTEAGRSQNRRIAVVILSDELAGADLVPQLALPAPEPPPPSQPTTETPVVVVEEDPIPDEPPSSVPVAVE